MGKAKEERKCEGWGERRCEEGARFARRNSERQTPAFKELLAFSQVSLGPFDQPGRGGVSSGRRRGVVGHEIPFWDSSFFSEEWEGMPFLWLSSSFKSKY